LIFSCVFSKYYIVVSAKDEKISINKLIQLLVILLFAFKASILISKIINGLDYSAVRDYYFRGEDRVEDLYLNSKILLYIYNYLYIPLFMYALISSIEKRKSVFFGAYYL
jgi:small-conductance mechanosensitive channel